MTFNEFLGPHSSGTIARLSRSHLSFLLNLNSSFLLGSIYVHMVATDLDERFMPSELILPLVLGCGWFEDIEHQSTLSLSPRYALKGALSLVWLQIPE